MLTDAHPLQVLNTLMLGENYANADHKATNKAKQLLDHY